MRIWRLCTILNLAQGFLPLTYRHLPMIADKFQVFTSYDAVLAISLPKGTTISDRLFVVMKLSSKAVRLLSLSSCPHARHHTALTRGYLVDYGNPTLFFLYHSAANLSPSLPELHYSSEKTCSHYIRQLWTHPILLPWTDNPCLLALS